MRRMENKDIVTLYNQPWRYHHDQVHLIRMKEALVSHQGHEWDILLNAIIFHDCVYEPFASDNEEKSNEKWIEYAKDGGYPQDLIDDVSRLILMTKHPESCRTPLEVDFRDADWNNMGNVHDISDEYAKWLDRYEDDIFREYQRVPVEDYVTGRLSFIEDSVEKELMTREVADYLRPLVRRKRRVGVYAGSFLPFHIGHLSVLRKAERMFDKVIVAQGINPEKKGIDRERFDNVSDVLAHHQVERYSGKLVDFMNGLQSEYCEPVLVRGLRNGYDLSQEVNFVQFLNDQTEWMDIPPIPIVYIHCEKELEHISSSAVRMLDPDDARFYIPGRQ